ncbi:hypothetical protein BKA57DRAFT_1106 [Linnemannia elongata]|nr:hypothetical protein BKA57DRAFT_1106 [Linnemannia elongata]
MLASAPMASSSSLSSSPSTSRPQTPFRHNHNHHHHHSHHTHSHTTTSNSSDDEQTTVAKMRIFIARAKDLASRDRVNLISYDFAEKKGQIQFETDEEECNQEQQQQQSERQMRKTFFCCCCSLSPTSIAPFPTHTTSLIQNTKYVHHLFLAVVELGQ